MKNQKEILQNFKILRSHYHGRMEDFMNDLQGYIENNDPKEINELLEMKEVFRGYCRGLQKSLEREIFSKIKF